MIWCDGCRRFVTGLYFCCVRCLRVNSGVEQSYDLCSECYNAKSFNHEHQVFQLRSYRGEEPMRSLQTLEQEPRQQNIRKGKEKVLEAGRLYFKFLTGAELTAAHKLFGEVDLNGDGRVHSNEVIDFLIRKGHWSSTEAQMTFDNMGFMPNTYLTLEDVVAFVYVMLNTPVCDGCGDILVGLYYTCDACFHAPNEDSYDLCPGCYSKCGKNDPHCEHGILVDNHSLLIELKNQQGSSSTGSQGRVTSKRKYLRKLVTEEAVKSLVNAAVGSACSIM